MPISDYHMVPLSAQYANSSPFSEHGQSQMYRELDGNQKEIRKLCEHQTKDEKAHLERRVNRQFFLQRLHGLGLGWSSTSSLGEISASSHAAISIVQMFKRAHLEPASFLQEFSHCFLQISYYTSPLEPRHFWSRFQHYFHIILQETSFYIEQIFTINVFWSCSELFLISGMSDQRWHWEIKTDGFPVLV